MTWTTWTKKTTWTNCSVEAGPNVVLRVNPDHLVHVPLRELLTSDRVRVVPTEPGPASDDPWDTATVVLAELT